MKFVAIFALSFFAFVPTAFAQSGLPSRIVPCDGVNCNLCHLVDLAQNLINIGIFISITLAAMTFAYAGFLYLSTGGDVSKATTARQIFTKVAIGLAIILGAWIGVDTLMKTVVDESKFGPWNGIGCGQTAKF
jgi:hypothetical protein